MKKLRQWVLAMQFLTRIPITNKSMPAEPEDFKGAMCFFTFIGLIIGGFTWLLFKLGAFIDPLLGALLATVGGIWITGGIHLDGLSDIFDGFGANRDAKRTLEIMKDSHIGTFGVVALMIDFAYHFIGFYLLKETPELIILVPISGKLGICFLCLIGKSISKGLGALWIKNISPVGFLFNLAIFSGMGLIFMKWNKVVLGLGLILIMVSLLNKKFTNKLEGLNGDCLGATQQMVEWMILTYLIIISKGLIGCV